MRWVCARAIHAASRGGPQGPSFEAAGELGLKRTAWLATRAGEPAIAMGKFAPDAAVSDLDSGPSKVGRD